MKIKPGLVLFFSRFQVDYKTLVCCRLESITYPFPIIFVQKDDNSTAKPELYSRILILVEINFTTGNYRSEKTLE